MILIPQATQVTHHVGSRTQHRNTDDAPTDVNALMLLHDAAAAAVHSQERCAGTRLLATAATAQRQDGPEATVHARRLALLEMGGAPRVFIWPRFRSTAQSAR